MNDRIKKKTVKRVFKMIACRVFEEKNGVAFEGRVSIRCKGEEMRCKLFPTWNCVREIEHLKKIAIVKLEEQQAQI